MKEDWKDIDGYDDWYQVSTLGGVRSWKNNKWGRADAPKLMTIRLSSNGYQTVNLRKNGKYVLELVHRLVAKAFIKNQNRKKCVNHLDGDKENNHVSNLEWCTYSENHIHAYKNGLKPSGEDLSHSTLTNDEVLEIRALWPMGCFRQHEIADAYDIDQATVSRIVNDQIYIHI